MWRGALSSPRTFYHIQAPQASSFIVPQPLWRHLRARIVVWTPVCTMACNAETLALDGWLKQEDEMRPFLMDVALVPAFVESDPDRRAGTVYVVVDVIRATTTLTVAFDSGCRRVLLAPDIETALERARREPGHFLLGGEREGVAPRGFDFGNSPAEYVRAELAGRELLFVTTNGTRALHACMAGYAVFAGSYRNAGAVVRAAIQSARSTEITSIVIVCAGRENQPAYDDTLCAGYLARKIMDRLERMGFDVEMESGARIAAELSDAAMACATPLRERLAESGAGRAVTRIGLEGDLDWCAAIDESRVAPCITGVEDGLLVLENDNHNVRS
jgi:2-phosphosulfolactate phosphatase